ncbi:CHAT domain-containing protein [Paludibaculum fermentans]|uniref:CHAT domain-containing protein n=1 Tax=Paludibaculum fermentans TaxID=1473598 RepID=UPI003EBA8B65
MRTGTLGLMLRWCLLFTLLLSGCSRFQTAPQTRYQEVSRLYRTGRLQAALHNLDERPDWRHSESSEWRSRFHTLRAEILLAQGKVAEASKDLADPAPGARWEARRQLVLGGVCLRQGRFDEGQVALQKAQQLAEQTGDSETALLAMVYEGARLARKGDQRSAEEVTRTALNEAMKRDDAYSEAAACNNMAFLRLRQLRYDESIAFTRQAVTAADRIDARWIAGRSATNAALCYAQLGDIPRALEWQSRVAANLELVGDRGNLKDSLGEMGSMYLIQGRFDEAIQSYRKAFDLARELHDDPATWAGNLALAFISAQRWQDAAYWNQQAWESKADSSNETALHYLRLNRGFISAGQSRFDEAARDFQQVLSGSAGNRGLMWDAHAGLARVEMARNRFDAAKPHFEAALQQIETARIELRNRESKITFLARLIRFHQDYVEALMARGEVEAALRVAESSRGRILAAQSERVSPQVAQDVVARARRFAAARKTAVLFYWTAPKRSWLWTITARGVRSHELPPAARLEEQVKLYRNEIEKSVRDPLREAADGPGSQLYQMLLGPASEAAGIARVTVIPDGPVHLINLESLPVPKPQPHFWLEDVTLSVAPSLTMLTASQPEPATGEGLLLVGAPEAPDPEYPTLESARQELSGIAAKFPALSKTVLEGGNATRTNYQKARAERFALVHFAAHAEVGRVSPLDSAIILAREGDQFRLYAREILATPKLHARLVTISACSSAGTTSYAGEGLIGLSWAFLEAGAQAVVAGLWDVSDSSSAELMTWLYEGIAAGRAPDEALRAAKLRMLKGGNFQRPYYWAPYQVYVR